MKAVQYWSNDDVRLVDLPVPDISAGEILVRVVSCGLCAADVLEWYMRPKAPVYLGHEIAGVVAKVGPDVTAFSVGDRVFVHHRAPCGHCDLCRRGHETLCREHRRPGIEPGGMAEYVRVTAAVVEKDVLPLPDGFGFEQAALVEPISCCVRALSRLSIDAGSRVLVIGAGFSGLVFVNLARLAGAASVAVVEPLPWRRQRALQFGADLAIDPAEPDVRSQLAGQLGGLATQVIVTPSSAAACEQAFDLADQAAEVLLFTPLPPEAARPFDFGRLFFAEWTVTASHGSGPADTRAALDLLASGAIDASLLVTHRFPLEEIASAVVVAAKPGNALKCIIEIGGEPPRKSVELP